MYCCEVSRRIRSSMLLVNVLQRNVHVARHLRAFGDRLDQLIGPMRRVGVEQADPEIARQRVQLAQQRAERRRVGRQRSGGRAEPLRRGIARPWLGRRSSP